MHPGPNGATDSSSLSEGTKGLIEQVSPLAQASSNTCFCLILSYNNDIIPDIWMVKGKIDSNNKYLME